MLLQKLRIWNTQDQIESDVASNEKSDQVMSKQDAISNVISLPVSSPLTQPAGLVDLVDKSSHKKSKHLGILDNAEIKEFFDKNHFGLGRHNGATYKTNNSLELGKKNIVSEFQNILHSLLDRNKNKHNKLQLQSIETVGLCEITSSMLDFAMKTVKEDMNLLLEQISLAEEGRGWILDALNSYQIGFGKGVREAIEFELI